MTLCPEGNHQRLAGIGCALCLLLATGTRAQEPARIGGVPPHTTAIPGGGEVLSTSNIPDVDQAPANWGIELVADRGRNRVIAVPLGSGSARYYVLAPTSLVQTGGAILSAELGHATCAAFDVASGKLLMGVAPPGGLPRIIAVDPTSGTVAATVKLPALMSDSEASSIIVDETRGVAYVTMRTPGGIVTVDLATWQVLGSARPVLGYDCEAGAIEVAANKGAFLFVKTTPGRLSQNAIIARIELATMTAEDQATLTVTDTRHSPRGFAYDPTQRYLYLASPFDRRVDRFEFQDLNARIHWTWGTNPAPPATLLPDPATGNIYARSMENCIYALPFGQTTFQTIACESTLLAPLTRSGLVKMGQRLLSASAGAALGTEVRSTGFGSDDGVEVSALLEERGGGVLPASSTDASGENLHMVVRDALAAALRVNIQTGASARELLSPTFAGGSITPATPVDVAYEAGGAKAWIGFSGTPAKVVAFDYSTMKEGRTCTLSFTDGEITAVAADEEGGRVLVALSGVPPLIARIDMASMEPVAWELLDGETEEVVDLFCSPGEGMIGMLMDGPGARLVLRGLDDLQELGTIPLGGPESRNLRGAVDRAHGRAVACVASGTSRSAVVVDLSTAAVIGSPVALGSTSEEDVPIVAVDETRRVSYIARRPGTNTQAISLESGTDRGILAGSAPNAITSLPAGGGLVELSDLPAPSTIRRYEEAKTLARFMRVTNTTGAVQVYRDLCFRCGPRPGKVRLAVYRGSGTIAWMSGVMECTGEGDVIRLPLGTIDSTAGFTVANNISFIIAFHGDLGEPDQFQYSASSFPYLDQDIPFAEFPPFYVNPLAGWPAPSVTTPAAAMWMEE